MLNKKVLHLRSSLGFFGAENIIVQVSNALAQKDYVPILGLIGNKNNAQIEFMNAAKQYGLKITRFGTDKKLDVKIIYEIKKYGYPLKSGNHDILIKRKYLKMSF